jgi:NgoPII restriction endonuclease
VANLIKVIRHLVENSLSDLQDRSKGKNRVNDMGDSLEAFITDIFANTLGESDESIRVNKHSQVFSYLGNANNPPDLIIRDSDAIEVKKIKSFKSEIPLNSSYPKSQLSASDPTILDSCRSVDGGNWEAKDLIYVIGVVKKNKLKRLWLVVGDCLAADYEIYKQIKDKSIIEIERIRDIEISKNRELGRFRKLDPLGIAYSQISGVWRISNPVNIYNYLNIDYNEEANLQVIAIMTEKKYLSFPQSDLDAISKIATEVTNLEIRDVQINSPNNPADLIDAKLITYQN